MAGYPDRTQRIVVVLGERGGEADWRVQLEGSPSSPPTPKDLAEAIARGALRDLRARGYPLESEVFYKEYKA